MVTVPTAHGKADLSIYRDAGNRVVDVLKKSCTRCIIEKASIDEVYIDVTEEAMHRLNTLDFANDILPVCRSSSCVAGQDLDEVALSLSLSTRCPQKKPTLKTYNR